MKPTRPAEPGPLRLAYLLWAPHRLGFFLAAVNLLAVSGWWAWFNALRWTGHPGMALPPGWLHAQLMVGAFMPLYFTGFLFTAGPRWLNVTAPTAPELLRGSVALCAGWWVAAIGAYWHPAWTSAGLLLSLLGWLDLLIRFIGLLRQSRQEDTLHARLIAVSGCVGAVLLAVSAVALQQGAWPLWHATLLGLLWFWIAPVFVIALHRMIPFFTAAAMPTLDDPVIDRYLDALWLEKGLADNSREAYRNDLASFNGWLQERGVRLAAAGREVILDHLAWRLNNGYKARSTARFLSRAARLLPLPAA